MNVQRIDSAKSTPAFGTLKPGIKMPAETFDKLINIPVVSNFSKNFDGDVYVGSFKAKIKNFFSRENRDMIVLKTHATNFEEFQVALNRRPKDALTRIFFSKD